jgi:UDP-N-acetylmuramate dehydrogenase
MTGSALQLQEEIPLAPLLSMRTGGSARRYTAVSDERQLVSALEWASRHGAPVLLLGGGTNLVCADVGFEGLVIRIELLGTDGLDAVEARGPSATRSVRAKAGEPWDRFVARCCAANLAGLECLSGIPGTVGATPIQNVGAYGQDVSQTIRSVRCLDRQTLTTRTFDVDDCAFAYRSSRFKNSDRDRHVVLEVEFALRAGGAPSVCYPELERALSSRGLTKPSLSQVREAVVDLRRSKAMVLETAQDRAGPNARSCGSFFVNPILTATEYKRLRARTGVEPPHHSDGAGGVKVPAAWLIEHAGFEKGHTEGTVGLSTLHTLCVVAHEGATSAALLAFARSIRERVRQRFGIVLRAEPVLVGLDF